MSTPPERVTPFQLFLFVVSLYVLAALAAETFFVLPAEVTRLLRYLDAFVCIFFFIDFCLRFARAPSKLEYMKWGWIDLIASIPILWHLQAARLFRVILIFRLIRALRSINVVMGVMFRNRAEGMFFSVASMTVLLVVFGAIAILLVEGPDPNSPIETAGDALWWAFVTITTVGYGDFYPVTTAGRIIACFLMIGGVGLFGSFAAYVSSLYVSEESEDDDRQHRASREMIRHLNSRMEELTEEVRALRAELQRPPTTGASGEEDKVEDAEGGDARMRRHLTGSNKPDQ